MKRYVLALLLIIFMVLYVRRELVSKKNLDNGIQVSPVQSAENMQSPSSNKKSVELADLIVEFDNQTFVSPATVTLDASGYLWTNKITYQMGYTIAIYEGEKPLEERETPEQKKPIKLTYNADNTVFSNFLTKCELNSSDISFYINQQGSQRKIRGLDAFQKLDTKFDPQTSTYVAYLNSFPRSINSVLLTDLVLGAPTSKYLLECGEETRAYVEGATIYYPKENLYVDVPEGLDIPRVIPDKTTLVHTISLFPLTATLDNTLRFSVTTAKYTLETPELDQLQIPVYEGGTTYTLVDNENIESREVLNIAGIPVLQITSTNSETSLKSYFLFRKLDSGKVAYIQVKFDPDKYAKESPPYIEAAKNLIVNVSEN